MVRARNPVPVSSNVEATAGRVLQLRKRSVVPRAGLVDEALLLAEHNELRGSVLIALERALNEVSERALADWIAALGAEERTETTEPPHFVTCVSCVDSRVFVG